MDGLEQAQRLYELSKYSDEELRAELAERSNLARFKHIDHNLDITEPNQWYCSDCSVGGGL